MELSSVQNEIYRSRDNLIIVAGAGSGKTRVLVEKYIDVFRDDPSLVIDQVVAMTFTDKAAREMKERVMKIAQEGLASDPKNEVYQKIKRDLAFSRISTIHSFCARLLRESALYINIDPDFKIINGVSASRRRKRFVESYIIENVKEIKKIFETDPTIKFSDLRKWLLDTIEKRGNGELPKINDEIKEALAPVEKILESYEKMEREESTLDFEDLLIFTRDFLKGNKDLKERYANYFRYIFIDEFQDTNRIQSEIIELLRTPANRVWYIGDPKQSIYAFRGADVDVFLEIIEKSHEKSV
ncbi:UvrD-helicase domain-containing protein, partial [Athalassotoga sp.]|uniref:UvrD-helicase domain-containing protein n=1 Tax=Athalassotoga sp. TaxID=2022597 RepID=UPI003CFEC12F